MKNLKLNKQTKLFIFIFLFTVFSGAIRKWVVSSSAVGNIVFAIQLIVPFVFYYIDNINAKKMFENKLLGAYVVYLVIAAINPLNKTIYHGLLGIILHLSFWFLAYYYLENREKFEFSKLLNTITLIAGGMIVLAFIQYQLPQGHVLNKYADEKNVGGIIAEVGTAVRVTGTFSYISGFAAYLLFHTFFVWALIKMQYRPAFTLALLFMGLVGCWMNGSRGITYIYIAISAYAIYTEARNTNMFKYVARMIVPAIIVTLVVLAKGNLGFESGVTSAYDNFEERRSSLEESGEQKSRIFQDFYVFSEFRFNYPVFGVGLGAVYQGAIVLFGTSDYVNEYGPPESENVRVMLEGGFILVAFRLMLIFSFCSRLSLPLLAKMMIGALFFAVPNVYNIYNSIFMLMGIAMLDKAYFDALAPTKKFFDPRILSKKTLNAST